MTYNCVFLQEVHTKIHLVGSAAAQRDGFGTDGMGHVLTLAESGHNYRILSNKYRCHSTERETF